MKNESKNSGEKDIARSGSAQPDNLNTGIQGRGHFINRISDWLSPITIDLIKSELALHKTDNLTKSELRNLQREISFSLFPNDPEPIGIIDSGYLPYFNDIGITDNIIYSGKAYFVDHALFSHPEIKTEEYEHLLDTLSEPDLVKLDDRHGNIALLFIKKFNKFLLKSSEPTRRRGSFFTKHSIIKTKFHKRHCLMWNL
ncbi:MAG: hypothetical protein KBS55_01035 [Bacteroidales bacterium]|nr:hypothetical protein [Candidatus Cryptobacteroides aphodequi]